MLCAKVSAKGFLPQGSQKLFCGQGDPTTGRECHPSSPGSISNHRCLGFSFSVSPAVLGTTPLS